MTNTKKVVAVKKAVPKKVAVKKTVKVKSEAVKKNESFWYLDKNLQAVKADVTEGNWKKETIAYMKKIGNYFENRSKAREMRQAVIAVFLKGLKKGKK